MLKSPQIKVFLSVGPTTIPFFLENRLYMIVALNHSFQKENTYSKYRHHVLESQHTVPLYLPIPYLISKYHCTSFGCQVDTKSQPLNSLFFFSKRLYTNISFRQYNLLCKIFFGHSNFLQTQNIRLLFLKPIPKTIPNTSTNTIHIQTCNFIFTIISFFLTQHTPSAFFFVLVLGSLLVWIFSYVWILCVYILLDLSIDRNNVITYITLENIDLWKQYQFPSDLGYFQVYVHCPLFDQLFEFSM